MLVHAGLHPHWNLLESQQYANEVEELLRGHGAERFLKVMYGDEPKRWSEQLSGYDRYRMIINCLTRMRYVVQILNWILLKKIIRRRVRI